MHAVFSASYQVEIYTHEDTDHHHHHHQMCVADPINRTVKHTAVIPHAN